MAITREKLELLITGDARDAVMAMRQASGAATGLDDSVGASATKMSKLGAVAGAAGSAIQQNIGMIATTAVAAMTAAAVASIREFTQLADKVRDFSRVSGLSAGQSSRLVAIFDDLKISQEAANNGFLRLNRGISSGTVNLQEYGAEAVRNRDGNLNIYKTLLSVADAYTSTSDSGRRAQLVQEAFGRGGAALIPILEQGREGIERLYGQVPEGQLLKNEDLIRAREFELALDDLNDSVMELKVGLGRELAPAVTGVASAAAGLIRAGGDAKSTLDSWGAGGTVLNGVLRGLAATVTLGASEVYLQVKAFGESQQSLDRLTSAQKAYGEALASLKKLQDEDNASTKELRDAKEALANARERYGNILDRTNAKQQTEIDKLEATKQSTYDLMLMKMGLEGAQIAMERATTNLDKVMGDSTATDLEKRDATLSASTAIMNYAREQLELEGQSIETEAGQKRFRDILDYIAGTLAPDNPLRSRLRDYKNDLEGIPTDVRTTFSVRLDTREIYGQLQDMGLTGEQAAEMIRASYEYLMPTRYEGATGGLVTRPTMALIGEAGPEAVIPLNRAPGASPLGPLGGGSMSITVPLVVDGRVLAEVTASELNRPGGPVIKQRAIV